MSIWDSIGSHIEQVTGRPFKLQQQNSVGGGCINSAYVIKDGHQSYFVKTNTADRLDMFEAEAAGLQEMADSNSIRVPLPICTGVSAGSSFLVMEHLPFGGGSDPSRMGEQLAAMHRYRSERFGWFRDNTIGATEQINDWEDDWVVFYRKSRLAFQLRLAHSRGASSRMVEQGERLLEALPQFFVDYSPAPSLLHGDLWSGNASFSNGEPVIFDPATYYGDREADLAMTELFGGFGGQFYAAYNASWQLDPGYSVRKTLYNLYHIINHFNLFGGGYGSQAESMIGQLLAEVH